MAPYTFTFGEVASKAPSAAGLIGKPSRLPTANGCWAGGCCCASKAPAAIPRVSVAAKAGTVIRFIGLFSSIHALPSEARSVPQRDG
jgi:hypothetical protein